MIGQYLLNTNEIATVLILLKILKLNKAQDLLETKQAQGLSQLSLLSPVWLQWFADLFVLRAVLLLDSDTTDASAGAQR